MTDKKVCKLKKSSAYGDSATINRKINSKIAIGIMFALSMLLVAIVIFENRKLSINNSASRIDTQVNKEKNVKTKEDDSEKFNSKLINLSFSHPSGSAYEERSVFEGKNDYKGSDIYFKDMTGNALSFEAISKDFVSAPDSVIHDIVEGNLSSLKTFKLRTLGDKKYTKIIERYPGMYQVVEYSSWECSPSVDTQLLVLPPEGSDLKYISFSLENPMGFSGDEMQEICEPKEDIIRNRINSIVEGLVPKVNEDLGSAITIAKTFAMSDDPISKIREVTVDLKKCNLISKNLKIKTANKEDISKSDFDTVVCGYLIKKVEPVPFFEDGSTQTNSYLRIIEFLDNDFKDYLIELVNENNTVNKYQDGNMDFNLGCYRGGSIVADSGKYINAASENLILNSSVNKPVPLILSFKEEDGRGCACCNFSYKITAIKQ